MGVFLDLFKTHKPTISFLVLYRTISSPGFILDLRAHTPIHFLVPAHTILSSRSHRPTPVLGHTISTCCSRPQPACVSPFHSRLQQPIINSLLSKASHSPGASETCQGVQASHPSQGDLNDQEDPVGERCRARGGGCDLPLRCCCCCCPSQHPRPLQGCSDLPCRQCPLTNSPNKLTHTDLCRDLRPIPNTPGHWRGICTLMHANARRRTQTRTRSGAHTHGTFATSAHSLLPCKHTRSLLPLQGAGVSP